MQNPIGEADLEWILHRHCEGTGQLPAIYENRAVIEKYKQQINVMNGRDL